MVRCADATGLSVNLTPDMLLTNNQLLHYTGRDVFVTEVDAISREAFASYLFPIRRRDDFF